MWSCSVMSDSLWPHGLCSWDFPAKNTGVGCHPPSPGDLPNPGIKLRSPTLQTDSLPSELPGKTMYMYFCICILHMYTLHQISYVYQIYVYIVYIVCICILHQISYCIPQIYIQVLFVNYALITVGRNLFCMIFVTHKWNKDLCGLVSCIQECPRCILFFFFIISIIKVRLSTSSVGCFSNSTTLALKMILLKLFWQGFWKCIS